MPDRAQEANRKMLIGLDEIKRHFSQAKTAEIQDTKIFYGIERLGGEVLFNAIDKSITIALPNVNKNPMQNKLESLLAKNGIETHYDDTTNQNILTINQKTLDEKRELTQNILCSIAASNDEKEKILSSFAKGNEAAKKNVRNVSYGFFAIGGILAFATLITMAVANIAVPVLIMTALAAGAIIVGGMIIKTMDRNSSIRKSINNLSVSSIKDGLSKKLEKHKSDEDKKIDKKFNTKSTESTKLKATNTKSKNSKGSPSRNDELLQSAEWLEDDIDIHASNTQSKKRIK
ncbi:hypothetical protein CAXC1_330082 [Candidatus Xenohaliotis californiensis]|uniref:Uncharacterized protein n=1 Tax=Candidatus Xenohaliotis californiensis TaxID=84677 RepID=A0ABM9N8R2_9RICK|nr:hypothetical protein CAXC1_330082 [Candidatus Xenohaliotis californiensis]